MKSSFMSGFTRIPVSYTHLLLRDFGINNYKALLGGFVFNDESADQAAHRILEPVSYTHLDVYKRQYL